MTNLLQSAASWLGTQLQSAAGRTVTIQQGSRVVPDIVASMTQHEYDVVDEESFLTKVLSCDWTFVAADLEAVGISLRAGAVLTETLNGVTVKYDVRPVGNKPAVENLDSSGLLVLVHTKKAG